MKIVETTCYSRLLWFLTEIARVKIPCVQSVSFTKPNFEHEGMNGYVETTVTFEVTDILVFARIWEEYFNLPPEERTKQYWKMLNENRIRC